MEREIINWAKARNLDNPDNKFQQLAKVMEELGELSSAMIKCTSSYVWLSTESIAFFK